MHGSSRIDHMVLVGHPTHHPSSLFPMSETPAAIELKQVQEPRLRCRISISSNSGALNILAICRATGQYACCANPELSYQVPKPQPHHALYKCTSIFRVHYLAIGNYSRPSLIVRTSLPCLYLSLSLAHTLLLLQSSNAPQVSLFIWIPQG